jgi:hypothetical protein
MAMAKDDLPENTTPEVVAYRLMLKVMEVEGRSFDGVGKARTSRNLILDTYADCIEAVRGQRQKRTPRAPTT